MSEIAAIKPKQLALTPQQFSALVLVEREVAGLDASARVLHQMGAQPLALALAAASDALRKAHEGYVESTQRAVSLATPADLSKLVATP